MWRYQRTFAGLMRCQRRGVGTSAGKQVAADARQSAESNAAAGAPGPERLGTVMVCVTEDWFALSHFQPLIRFLVGAAREVVVVTRSSGRLGEIEALGARIVALDYHRSSLNPLREAATARRLAGIIAAERPDIVHLIAMKPIVHGALALRFNRGPKVIVHMTGLGFLAISDTLKARLVRPLAMRLIAGLLRRPGSWLIVENPEDLAFLREGGADPGARVTTLGGAGVEPREFEAVAASPPDNAVPVAAYVGRMIRPKGVDLLLAAQARLDTDGVPVAIELYGRSDDGNPEAIPAAELEAWSGRGHGRWRGHTADVAGVWRRSDIFVLPARSREGMPRALLEAAASARPLVVTDVPGCRHFVRDGVEGLVVPANDVGALAAALSRLARDPALRRRMGQAAHARCLSGFTIAHVVAGLAATYEKVVRS